MAQAPRQRYSIRWWITVVKKSASHIATVANCISGMLWKQLGQSVRPMHGVMGLRHTFVPHVPVQHMGTGVAHSGGARIAVIKTHDSQ